MVLPKKDEAFYEAKGALEKFLKQFGAPKLEMKKGESLCSYAHPNKYAEYISVDNEPIARAFELHPLVAKNYDIENVRIGMFEINFTKLTTILKREFKYQPLPKFPGIEFDVSVVVDRKIPVGDLQKTIRESDAKLVRNVDLFDLYEGPNIPDNRKAAAFKISLRSDERTLTDDEMKKIQQKIFASLKKMGGEIRGM